METHFMITSMHHFGMMVDDLEGQVKFYESLGFKVAQKFSYDSIGAQAALLKKDSIGLELWQFPDPVNELAQKIKKHSAFTTNDLDNDLQKFLDAGYELAIPV